MVINAQNKLCHFLNPTQKSGVISLKCVSMAVCYSAAAYEPFIT